MNRFISAIFIFSFFHVYSQQQSSWQIWIIPDRYTINLGDTLKLVLGISGYGELDPINLKITAYSEHNTAITIMGDPSWQYDTYMITSTDKSPKNRFIKKNERYPNSILLHADYDSGFDKLLLKPVTNGDKKLILIATYSPDGKNWYTTSRELSYHVNSWVEKYQTWLAVLSLVSIFLAFPFFNVILSRWFEKRSMRPAKKKR